MVADSLGRRVGGTWRWGLVAEVSKQAPEIQGRRVLVVDDDADIRTMVQLILEASGYRVATASDGADALRHLAANGPPSLILLDLMMPLMGGEEFRAEQLRDPRLASIPVVVVSARPQAAEKAARMGALACLQKPFEVEELLDVVRRGRR